MADRGKPIKYTPKKLLAKFNEYIENRGFISYGEFEIREPATVSGFCVYIGCGKAYLRQLTNTLDYSTVKDIIYSKLETEMLNNSLLNKYNSTIAKLVLTNAHGYKDKAETENKTININHNTDSTEKQKIDEWLSTLKDDVIESKSFEELEKMYEEYITVEERNNS